MIAELCTQCARIKHLGTGKGWCYSLQCGFLRAYDMIDQLLRIMDSIAPQLQGDKSEITAHLLPFYAEAEKTAVGLLWQMSTVLRYVSLGLCGGNGVLDKCGSPRLMPSSCVSVRVQPNS